LEELRAGERIDMEPSDPVTAEMITNAGGL